MIIETFLDAATTLDIFTASNTVIKRDGILSVHGQDKKTRLDHDYSYILSSVWPLETSRDIAFIPSIHKRVKTDGGHLG